MFDEVSYTYTYMISFRPGGALIIDFVFGERSVMAVQAARDAGFKDARHIRGGVDAWDKENGPLGIPV